MQKIGLFGAKSLAFLAIFVGALFQFWDLNSDIWFILNSGRYVMANGIPYTEPLAMHEGLDYVMEQWLTCVLFWNIYDCFGADGLLAFTFLIGCLLLYAYYRLCSFIGNSSSALLLVMDIGAIGCPFFLTTRPQIFSTLFFVIEVYYLERYVKSAQKRFLVPLVVMSVILINLHAALWPMLLIILCPYIIVPFLSKYIPTEYAMNYNVSPILKTALGIFLCGFLNPYGFNAMSFVFRSFDPKIHGQIHEVFPSSFSNVPGMIFVSVLLIVVGVISRFKMPAQYILLTVMTGIMGMMTIRSMFIFLFIGTLPLSYAMKNRNVQLNSESAISPKILELIVIALIAWILYNNPLFEIPIPVMIYFSLSSLAFLAYFFFYSVEDKRFSMEIPSLRIKYSIALLILLIPICFFPYYKGAHNDNYGEHLKPVFDYLSEHENKEEVVLWTGFNTGAYAGFRGFKYYVDARPEVFAPSNTHIEKDIIGEYFNLINGKIYYKDFFANYNFTHVLVCKGDRLLHLFLEYDNDFDLIYEMKGIGFDDVYRLYRINTKK